MAESPLKYKIFDSKDMAQSICAYIFIISSYFFLFLHPSLRVDHHQIMNLFLHFFFIFYILQAVGSLLELFASDHLSV
jgi:hypothetical protein